jgi:hypothetical protein
MSLSVNEGVRDDLFAGDSDTLLLLIAVNAMIT